MESIINKPISYHRNNIRDWFVEPCNWENKKRLTYKEVAEKIIRDRDLDVVVEDGGCIVYYNSKNGRERLRGFPEEVWEYIENKRRKVT